MAQPQARSVQDIIAAFPAAIVVDISYLRAKTKLAVLHPGMRGYTPMYTNLPRDYVERLAMAMYGCRAATKAEQEAAICGSMFGWDCPAADPANYDEDGKLIPIERR